jgi:hypothetical protein
MVSMAQHKFLAHKGEGENVRCCEDCFVDILTIT